MYDTVLLLLRLLYLFEELIVYLRKLCSHIGQSKYFVISDLQAVFHAQFLGASIICVYTKFHVI